VAKGCKCTKSRCIKGYCECFSAGRGCTELCGCADCANELGIRPPLPGEPENSQKRGRALSQVTFTKLHEPGTAHDGEFRVLQHSHGPRNVRRKTGRPRGRPAVKRNTCMSPPQSSAAGCIAPRNLLDDLIAATDAVEAGEMPAQPSATPTRHADRKLLSGDWADLLPSQAELQRLQQFAAARAIDGSSGCVSGSRLPQACFLLPAGTPVDARTRYVVTPCRVGAPAEDLSNRVVELQPSDGGSGAGSLQTLVPCERTPSTMQHSPTSNATHHAADDTPRSEPGEAEHALEMAACAFAPPANRIGTQRAAMHPALALEVPPAHARDVAMTQGGETSAFASASTPFARLSNGIHVGVNGQADQLLQVCKENLTSLLLC
jgi:Tesmin/TSO1-like CXC domain, cysteine-rich domain